MPHARRSILTLLAVLLTLGLGVALTLGTVRVEKRVLVARLDRMADLVAGRLEERMVQHIALLQATRAYFEAERAPALPDEFAAYVAQLDLAEDYRGIQGIGFAPLLPATEAARAAARIGADNALGGPAGITPTDQPLIGPIVLLQPQDDRNRTALGYDMFSEPVRRAAMQAALASGEARASAPVQLVQEITAAKQQGVLIYLPTRVGLFGTADRRDAGFIYAPFRAGDLHEVILAEVGHLPLAVRTVDPAEPGAALFDNIPADHRGQDAVQRDISVAGRTWTMRIVPMEGFWQRSDHSASLTVGLLSVLLLIAVAAGLHSFGRSLDAARQTAALAARRAEERTLLLREMQHRIKNHIARIQAISRQTTRESRTLEEFAEAFGSRLRAMAKAQDALGRDGTGTADLRGLLRSEIEQVMEREHADSVLDGPEVGLAGRAAQAMGLVAHELATNAMKYAPGDRLVVRVNWSEARRGTERWLDFRWTEPEARPPEGQTGVARGFGSELIEALIEGDLGGRLERRLDDKGLTVHITFPLTDV